MAGSYLQIISGDSYSFSTNVAVDNVAQNVYGAEISFYALANPDLEGVEPIININSTAGYIAVSGNNNNTITVTMNSAFTNNITQANVATWFLRAELSNGSVYTLDKGRLCVMPGFAPLPL
jgi:hypothetical protein